MGSGRILAIGTVFVTVVAAGDTPCPDVCTCPSLYRADCCSASLTHIPSNLVTDVRFLNASGNNFYSLRKGAFSINHIKVLDLSNNRISAIENDAFGELEYLIFLYLGRNEIISLDQNVFRMNHRLEFLVLDNNMLDVPVGRSFLNIPSLKSLDISSCNITSLPQETFVMLPHLEELRLAYNRLQTLHSKVFHALKSLKYLYLSHNLLTVLQEDAFFKLEKLAILDLSNNKLQTLHPEVFRFLKSVELLKLSSNRLKTLQFGVFAPLASLERLYLDKNKLSVLNGRQFSELNNLAFLDISGNHFDSVQVRQMCYLRNLTYLKVSDNRLACDCALWELWKWSLEKGVRLFSTCNEPYFEFSVKNFELFRFNNSCNSTFCDVRTVTEFSEQILDPVYLYAIISVSLLLVFGACGITFCAVVRYSKEFCKPRSTQVTVNDYPHSTISSVGRQHNEFIVPGRCHKTAEDVLRHERLRKNRVNMGHSVSLKVLPTVERRNIRHSYHECRVPAVAEDDRKVSKAETLPSNNMSPIFLHSMCGHTPKLETQKDRSISEPKLKVCRNELSHTDDSLHTCINPLSVSTLECKTSL